MVEDLESVGAVASSADLEGGGSLFGVFGWVGWDAGGGGRVLAGVIQRHHHGVLKMGTKSLHLIPGLLKEDIFFLKDVESSQPPPFIIHSPLVSPHKASS